MEFVNFVIACWIAVILGLFFGVFAGRSMFEHKLSPSWALVGVCISLVSHLYGIGVAWIVFGVATSMTAGAVYFIRELFTSRPSDLYTPSMALSSRFVRALGTVLLLIGLFSGVSFVTVLLTLVVIVVVWLWHEDASFRVRVQDAITELRHF